MKRISNRLGRWAVMAGGSSLITIATCDPYRGFFDFYRDDDFDYYDSYYYGDFIYYDGYGYEDCFFFCW